MPLPREVLFSAGRAETQPLSEVTGNRLLEYGLCRNSHNHLTFRHAVFLRTDESIN